MNYLQNVVIGNSLENCKIIPINGCPTRFLEVDFNGWKSLVFDVNDENFSNVLEIAASTIKNIVDRYKDKCAFSDPIFSFKPQHCTFSVKIGMMEMEMYNEIYGIKT